jgi:hypothetical protein
VRHLCKSLDATLTLLVQAVVVQRQGGAVVALDVRDVAPGVEVVAACGVFADAVGGVVAAWAGASVRPHRRS